MREDNSRQQEARRRAVLDKGEGKIQRLAAERIVRSGAESSARPATEGGVRAIESAKSRVSADPKRGQRKRADMQGDTLGKYQGGRGADEIINQ